MFGCFRFGLDFPIFEQFFEDFKSLEVNFSTSDTKEAHPHAKPRLLSHHASKSAENVGELMKQEEADEKVEKRAFGTVYFTHVGSRFRGTDRYEIWQFSFPDQR